MTDCGMTASSHDGVVQVAGGCWKQPSAAPDMASGPFTMRLFAENSKRRDREMVKRRE
jgi:hypothetical protein